MIRSKGEAGTGNVVEAVRHIRMITGEIRRLAVLDQVEPPTAAKEHGAPLGARQGGRQRREAPVIACSARAVIATPADAALMMQLGAEGNFVGSGIAEVVRPGGSGRGRSRPPPTSTIPSAWPPRRQLGEAMPGIEIGTLLGERRPAPEPRLPSGGFIGVLAPQGGFEAHAKALPRARRRAA